MSKQDLPSYYEVTGETPPPPPPPGPTVATPPTPPTPPTPTQFGAERLETTCRACHCQVLTTVKDQIKPEGWCFAICCFFFGSWCASCLVCCLPGFKVFSHFCPSCGALIGVGEPSHSCSHLLIILGVSALVIAVITFLYFNILSRDRY